jgi:hemerythrin-like domain-containing protein
MKKERYNIFNKSHKGLRRLVLEAWAKTNKCDFRSRSEVNECIVILLQAIRYYIYHIRKEDMIIYRAINLSAPYIITLLEEINAKGIKEALSIENKIYQFNSESQGKDIIDFGIELQSSIFSFTSVVVQHIKKEETVLNELLWQSFTDCELLELEVKTISHFVPEEKEWFHNQVMKCLDDNEIARWIDHVLSFGNAYDADLLMETTRSALPESRWQTISRNIMQRA